MRYLVLSFTILCVLAGCGGPDLSGDYHIVDTAHSFGEGTEKSILHVFDDKSLEIQLGNLSTLKASWTQSGGDMTWDSSTVHIPGKYHIKDKTLIPVVDGKEVTGWHWQHD